MRKRTVKIMENLNDGCGKGKSVLNYHFTRSLNVLPNGLSILKV